jgi:hypothetical protein
VGGEGAVHELGRAGGQEWATETWKRTQEEDGRAEAELMVVEKATVHSPSLIRRPLKTYGEIPRQKIQESYLFAGNIILKLNIT